jgi:hypothetical protein
MNAFKRMFCSVLILLLSTVLLAGCGGSANGQAVHESTEVTGSGQHTIKGEVWADNWFALYSGDELIVEDSVPITTERSFNAEVFTFKADYPLQLNFVVKDFKSNDTGLEYIGTGRQQMGDGGLIAQFTDVDTGEVIAVTNLDWQCLVIHKAPLDEACADESDPEAGVGPCTFEAMDEPDGWKMVEFDDSGWISATEHSVQAVRPKHGYDEITWDSEAKIVWSGDLEKDNTVLLRAMVDGS